MSDYYSVNSIVALAFAEDITVVMMYPVDFRAVAQALFAKVESSTGPTPRSMRYEYFTLYTARGCIDVISDPDMTPGQLHPAPFAGELPPTERAISPDLDISPARAAAIRDEFNQVLDSITEQFSVAADKRMRRMVERLCVALGAPPRTP